MASSLTRSPLDGRRVDGMQTPGARLAGFISKYSPTVAAEGRTALDMLRRLVPGAVELVYDNYNGLVVGFSASDRSSDAVLSLLFTPRWLTLCFLQHGPDLPDPHQLLRGSGTRVRHVRLDSAQALDTPAVRALIEQALACADVPIDPHRLATPAAAPPRVIEDRLRGGPVFRLPRASECGQSTERLNLRQSSSGSQRCDDARSPHRSRDHLDAAAMAR
jgi:hypothetical protein